MGASLKAAGGGGGRRRRGRRHAAMSEINVTPMVDVMLVLLIIFMVAAPLLTTGLPVDLPQAKGQQLQAKEEPLVITVQANGDVAIGETKVPLDGLVDKLKAIAKNGAEQSLVVKADKVVPFGIVIKVMGRLGEAGFKKMQFLAEGEGG
jgi:biopolymer transport protein TolR